MQPSLWEKKVCGTEKADGVSILLWEWIKEMTMEKLGKSIVWNPIWGEIYGMKKEEVFEALMSLFH